MTSHDPHREESLICRAIEGDRSAAGELLYISADRLTRFISQRLPKAAQDTISPEDVLQETFKVAFRDIGKFEMRGGGAFYGWLRTIALHQIQDVLKAQQRKKRGGDRQRVRNTLAAGEESIVNLFDVLTGDDRTPLRKASRREALQFMQVALAELPDQYRQAIHLQYVEQMSYEEIADAMDTTPGAVQGFIKRAKQRLRDSLGNASAYLSSR